MNERAVFLDTSALIALNNKDDLLHEQATMIRDEIGADGSPLLLSEFVLIEFLNAFSRPLLRVRGVEASDQLRSSKRVSIVGASDQLFAAALALYRSRPDKSWSLVDCSSIYLCRRHRIRRAFTHDRHFAQAGLTVLLK